MTEPNGRRHELQRNDAGITVGYGSNHDVNWELELDDSNRVVGLNKEGAEYRIAYAGSRLTTISHPAGEQKFHYDGDDRLTHATGVSMRLYDVPRVSYESDGLTTVDKDDMTLSYLYNKAGRLSRISKNEAVYHVVHDPNGFVVTLLKNNDFRRFIRNEMGRVSLILYPNGASSQHHYDELGNRSRIEYSNGGSMTISHDGRGNIVHVVDENPDGASVSQSYTIGEHNRVTEISLNDDTRLQVSYDYLGRPAKFSHDGENVAVEYFATGDPIRLRSATSNLIFASASEKNIVLPVHPSPRGLFHNDMREHGQPDYGVVSISDASFDISIVPVENGSVPGYKEAASASLAIDSWFDPKTRGKIEKPSNPIFQPPEYESTNCCISCLWNMQCGQICSKIFMGIGEQTCLCFSVYSSGVGGGGGGCDPNYKATKARAEKIVRKTLVDAPDDEPREIFFTVDCPYSSRVGRTVKSEEYDLCPEAIMNEPPIIYAGHTHPKLNWDRDRYKTLRCRGKHGVFLDSLGTMRRQNMELNKCSKHDNRMGNKYPLYLRKPDMEIIHCGKKWRN